MLELKSLVQEASTVALTYEVKHNVGRLRTTLDQNFRMYVDPETGAVEGSLVIERLYANSVDAAREKMAFWCERMAAALRGAQRKSGDLPVFERRSFDLDSLPLWLREEYARLVQRFVAAETVADYEAIEDWLRDHPMQLVSDIVEIAQCEADRLREEQGKAPSE